MKLTATVQVTFEISVDVQSKRTLTFEQMVKEARQAAINVASDRESLIPAMSHGHAKIAGAGSVRVVTVDDDWLKG